MRKLSETRGICRLTAYLLVLLVLCSGCASIPVQSGHYTSGKILLLPPRDLVQAGKPHPKGVGSGAIFQGYLKENLNRTPFEVVTTDNQSFSATKIAEKKVAIEEAKRLNAAYCLQIVLGEFLNAAPMTFRPDHASVEKAIMYDVSTGDIVWELIKPLYLKKGNPGNHLVLLNKHARTIATSIRNNMK